MSDDALTRRMRAYETTHYARALPSVYLVVRLDGRAFTRLTKQEHDFEVPFDLRFRAMMVETTAHLLASTGLDTCFGYTHSDEISILLPPHSEAFGRRLDKLCSVVAGTASAVFSLALGSVAVFDARVCQLPTRPLVIDYFGWRQRNAQRNAVSAHCHAALRRSGLDSRAATERLHGCSLAQRRQILVEHGTDVTRLPNWQTRGVAVVWHRFTHEGFDPSRGEPVTTLRRRLATKLELPVGADFERWVEARVPG